MRVFLLDIKLEIELITPLDRSFQTPSEMNTKGIRVRYALLMPLPSILKDTVDMN